MSAFIRLHIGASSPFAKSPYETRRRARPSQRSDPVSAADTAAKAAIKTIMFKIRCADDNLPASRNWYGGHYRGSGFGFLDIRATAGLFPPK
jgi:hypothetical protein